jgi:hypothetical protein
MSTLIATLKTSWSRAARILDGALSVLLAITCCVLLYRTFVPRTAPPAAKPPSVSVGDKIPVVPDLHLDRADVTLLMALREGCRYCDASMPFYRQLLSTTQSLRANGRLQILLLAPADAGAAQHYLEAHDLAVDGVVSIPRERQSEFKIAGTPTLLQVSRDGTIKSVWAGQLAKDSEESLRRTLLTP